MLYSQLNHYFSVNFTINLEVKIRLGVQHNETFREWHEMPGRDATLVKTNGSKASSLFQKVGNITSNS